MEVKDEDGVDGGFVIDGYDCGEKNLFTVWRPCTST